MRIEADQAVLVASIAKQDQEDATVNELEAQKSRSVKIIGEES